MKADEKVEEKLHKNPLLTNEEIEIYMEAANKSACFAERMRKMYITQQIAYKLKQVENLTNFVTDEELYEAGFDKVEVSNYQEFNKRTIYDKQRNFVNAKIDPIISKLKTVPGLFHIAYSLTCSEQLDLLREELNRAEKTEVVVELSYEEDEEYYRR